MPALLKRLVDAFGFKLSGSEIHQGFKDYHYKRISKREQVSAAGGTVRMLLVGRLRKSDQL